MIHSGSFCVRRRADEAFDLLSNPERFAPLLPDFEGMAMQDATHFKLRTAIAIGKMQGHANLAMELVQASRPARVEYRGSSIIAGSPLRMAIDFQINPREEVTEVTWQGEVQLDGILALMAGNFVEKMGRQNFERMAERVQQSLQGELLPPKPEPEAGNPPPGGDFEI